MVSVKGVILFVLLCLREANGSTVLGRIWFFIASPLPLGNWRGHSMYATLTTLKMFYFEIIQSLIECIKSDYTFNFRSMRKT